MRFLVLQHMAGEGPQLLEEYWRRDGIGWDAVALNDGAWPAEPLTRWDGLVVMGGPQNPWEEAEHSWLAAERALIRRWVLELDRPCLGICLGHELLAEALGGSCGPMASAEVGIRTMALTAAAADDPLFAALPPRFEAFQWHEAEVVALPADAVILAGNGASAVQAFRWGRHAWGCQFHLEVVPEGAAGWVTTPDYGPGLIAALGPEAPALLTAALQARRLPLRAQAEAIHRGFHAAARRARER